MVKFLLWLHENQSTAVVILAALFLLVMIAISMQSCNA